MIEFAGCDWASGPINVLTSKEFSKQNIETTLNTEGIYQLIDEIYILIANVGTANLQEIPEKNSKRESPVDTVLRKIYVHTLEDS